MGKSVANTGIILFLLLVPGSLFALDSILLKDPGVSYYPGLALEYLEDPEKSFSFKELISGKYNSKFKASQVKSPNFAYTSSAYWLRFKIKNPLNRSVQWILLNDYPLTDDMKLYIPEISGEKAVKHTGRFRPFDTRDKPYRAFPLLLDIPAGEEYTCYLRIESEDSLVAILSIISPETFEKQAFNEQFLFGGYFGFILVMILYYLFIYVSTRDLAQLYYVLTLISLHFFFELSLTGYSAAFIDGDSLWWSRGSISLFICLGILFGLLFAKKFLRLRKKIPLLNKVVEVVMVLITIVGIASFFVQYFYVIFAGVLISMAAAALMVVSGIISLKRGFRPARFYLLAWTSMLVLGFFYGMKVLGIFPSFFLAEFGFQIGSACHALLMSLALADLINTITREKDAAQGRTLKLRESMTKRLEKRVQRRTAELRTTLDNVQELKNKQDGDYFLTTLLIQPLTINKIQSEHLQIDFLVQQKKQFRFKKWDRDIGGDICIAQTVTLAGGDYTIVVNADAMGKSMQGAGGALVFGAVFQSIIQRTLLEPEIDDFLPELWLKEVYLELHNVFLSFDGSMLMSAVLALIDDKSALLYYINAEHPFPVLYRGEEGSFFGHELIYKKIGTPGLVMDVHIQTIALETGDIVLLGSDGRDDIVVGEDEGGQRIFNDEEDKFRKVVQESRGDLKLIHTQLENMGDLTDDLSLVRIQYKGPGVPKKTPPISGQVRELLKQASAASKEKNVEQVRALARDINELQGEHPGVQKNLFNLFYSMKLYPEAAVYAESYALCVPADLKMRYHAAYCYKMAGNLRRAHQMGESLRLRDASNVKNLLNLADISFMHERPKLSMEYLEKAREQEPDNSGISKILAAIEIKYGALD